MTKKRNYEVAEMQANYRSVYKKTDQKYGER